MSPIPSQIAKLIPRLASEHDGEVVAVVRAIDRLLRTAKTRTLIAEVQGQLYIGQNFYLAPRHKRLLTKLLRTTRPIEGEVA